MCNTSVSADEGFVEAPSAHVTGGLDGGSRMRHRILTCKNHPALRWSCKDIAWTGYYNGCRNLRFCGVPDGTGMHSDRSGLSCTQITDDFKIIEECSCPTGDLILAPEDALVAK
jgi:hypothetical protein